MVKSSTYLIGCKLPSGLTINHAGQSVTLSGTNASNLINGFGITHHVPAELWEGFLKTFAQQPIIKNGIVFAVTDKQSAQDAAAERAGQKTGLEQVDANKQQSQPDKDSF